MDTQRKFLLGGNADCFKAAVSISGPDLDPDEISRLLGCPADSSHRKGDPRKRGAPFADGLWSIERSGAAGQEVDVLVTEILDKLSQTPDVWQELCSKYLVSVDVGLFVTGGNREALLSKETIRRIGLLGAALWIDMYCTSTERAAQPSD